MTAVYVSVNVENVRRDLRGVERQIPFAMALAINRVAVLARKKQIGGIFERFNVRQKGFLSNAITMDRASKGKLVATLTMRDPFLAQHEEGGAREPGDIFSSLVRAVSPKAKRAGALRGPNTPRGVLLFPTGFTRRLRTGKVGVFRRKSGLDRAKIELVFALERKVQLAPRLRFAATVGEVVDHEWERAFAEELDHAIETRK